MTNIQTPVTIYTNGNGCKWINDAEGEAVDFVTVADALNRTADREAVLVAALERLRDCDWVITLPDRMDAVREIAREALAKYRGER